MNDDLDTLSNWARKNRLTVNEDKTKYMLVNSNIRRDTQMPNLPKVKSNNVVLERVEQYEYLGITLHERLPFEPHLNKLIVRMQSKNYMLA